jgi:hypothetical protein
MYSVFLSPIVINYLGTSDIKFSVLSTFLYFVLCDSFLFHLLKIFHHWNNPVPNFNNWICESTNGNFVILWLMLNMSRSYTELPSPKILGHKSHRYPLLSFGNFSGNWHEARGTCWIRGIGSTKFPYRYRWSWNLI